jgi:hypothetical protein
MIITLYMMIRAAEEDLQLTDKIVEKDLKCAL